MHEERTPEHLAHLRQPEGATTTEQIRGDWRENGV